MIENDDGIKTNFMKSFPDKVYKKSGSFKIMVSVVFNLFNFPQA